MHTSRVDIKLREEVIILIKIRPIQESDESFLWDMLFEMIYLPEDVEKSRDLLNYPDIYIYLDGFGQRNGDTGFVAEDENNQLIGAAWFRLFDAMNKGYGYINDQTPELCIAVIEKCRGNGIGTRLLKTLIEIAKWDGYASISLSVDSRNPANKLYQKMGFEPVKVIGTSWTMELTI